MNNTTSPMTPQMLALYRLLAGATVEDEEDEEDEDPRKASSPETKTDTSCRRCR